MNFHWEIYIIGSRKKYIEWIKQKELEDERITIWLETGKDPVVDIDEEYKVRLLLI